MIIATSYEIERRKRGTLNSLGPSRTEQVLVSRSLRGIPMEIPWLKVRYSFIVAAADAADLPVEGKETREDGQGDLRTIRLRDLSSLFPHTEEPERLACSSDFLHTPPFKCLP